MLLSRACKTGPFCRAFWDIVSHDMLDVCNESVVSGSLPLSCRRAVITLLPKKGHLHEIKKSRHPVSGLQDSAQGFGLQAERSYEAMAKIPLCFFFYWR